MMKWFLCRQIQREKLEAVLMERKEQIRRQKRKFFRLGDFPKQWVWFPAGVDTDCCALI